MSEWISSFPGYQQALGVSKRCLARVLRTGPVPKHIGFVMDGNRRFAKKNHIELKEGHNAGFESMARILEICYDCGVESVTVFAFSIENFKRSKFEIDWLMELAKARFSQIVDHGELCEQYGVRIRVLGDKKLLPPDVLEVMDRAELITKDNSRAILNVCFPYTSRNEMTHAMRSVIKKCARDDLAIDDIDQDTIDRNLFTKGSSKLDLVIRTSGVTRLSDFLLWQVVDENVSIEFLDTLWPDLSHWDIIWILIKFSFNASYYGGKLA